MTRRILWAGAAVFLLASQGAMAGPLRDFLERRAVDSMEESDGTEAASLPADIQVVRDVEYGSDPKQRFDVYVPRDAKNAPVLFMVHGGAWFLGDKSAKAVVQNKVARWVPRGFIVISTNYRLLPDAAPIEQAKDVARAIATAQSNAASWGGDRNKFIVMGHSAGAHLVSLLATSPSLSSGIVSTPWLGTVSLDSAALDVVQIMEAKHARFYDRAFSRDPAYWKAASPFHAVAGAGRPILMVCSSKREDSCPQAKRFISKARSVGLKAAILEQDLSHKDVNQQLGEEGSYTSAVEAFLASIDNSIAQALRGDR